TRSEHRRGRDQLSGLHVGVTKAFREKDLTAFDHDNDATGDAIMEELRRHEGVEEDFQIGSRQVMTLRVIATGVTRRRLGACRRIRDTERQQKPCQCCKYCVWMN